MATAAMEHQLNTGHTLYLMRRQKHARVNKNVKQKDDDEHLGDEGGGSNAAAGAGNASGEDYEKAIKKIATFHTVEEFWRVYGHICRPNEVPHSTDFHMFREGIKPVWEDPSNKRGGKLVVKVRKGLGARYWESLLLAVIGEQFGDLANEVCGVVISVRHNEDVLSLWTRNSDNTEAVQKMKEILKRSLKLPSFVPIEYKRHDIAEPAPSSSNVPQVGGMARGPGAAWRTARPTNYQQDWRS